MRLGFAFIGALLVLLLPNSAIGDYENGNWLFNKCAARDVVDELQCMTYIAGVHDGFFAGVVSTISRHEILEGKIRRPAFCKYDGVTQGQLKDVAFKYLRDNPADRQWPAAFLLLKAFSAAFPCPNDMPSAR